MNCPSSILIEVGKSGPFPVDVKLPNVTDNSGGAVFMNVIYPINFTSPYLFKQVSLPSMKSKTIKTFKVKILVFNAVLK